MEREKLKQYGVYRNMMYISQNHHNTKSKNGNNEEKKTLKRSTDRPAEQIIDRFIRIVCIFIAKYSRCRMIYIFFRDEKENEENSKINEEKKQQCKAHLQSRAHTQITTTTTELVTLLIVHFPPISER